MGEGEKIVAAEITYEREYLSMLGRENSLDNLDGCLGLCDMHRKMPPNEDVGDALNPTCVFSRCMAQYA